MLVDVIQRLTSVEKGFDRCVEAPFPWEKVLKGATVSHAVGVKKGERGVLALEGDDELHDRP